ncbi:MAG: hypothetical protein LAT76_12895 [Schleiferiaceae bacterium]|nr:hypothetical protein [Schleiferiaceae bacterium]
MKFYTLLASCVGFFALQAQNFTTDFTRNASIVLSSDTLAPQHIVESDAAIYVITEDTIYTISKSSQAVTKSTLDRSFKVGLLSQHLAKADSLYDLAPMDMAGADVGKGGSITGCSAFGDTLVFTYAFTYGKKVGPNTIPAIHMFLGFFHNGKLNKVIEIEHGIVMSIDMPTYFINPASFQMQSPTTGIFSVTSLKEKHPFLFASYVVNKNGKLEMDRVLRPILCDGLINERPELTLLGASQNYISLPFMGGIFSNEVWNDEKKAKMSLIPSKETPQLGIKLRLGEPVPPAFGIIDLIAVDDNTIKALVLEKKMVSLTHFEFKKSNVLRTKEVFDAAVDVENMPNIGLLSDNKLYHFDNTTLHIYTY